jgi:hypothetical protein
MKFGKILFLITVLESQEWWCIPVTQLSEG